MQRLATPVMNLAQDPEPCLLSTICRSSSTSLRSSATTSSRLLQGSAVLGMSSLRWLSLSNDWVVLSGSEIRGTTHLANL